MRPSAPTENMPSTAAEPACFWTTIVFPYLGHQSFQVDALSFFHFLFVVVLCFCTCSAFANNKPAMPGAYFFARPTLSTSPWAFSFCTDSLRALDSILKTKINMHNQVADLCLISQSIGHAPPLMCLQSMESFYLHLSFPCMSVFSDLESCIWLGLVQLSSLLNIWLCVSDERRLWFFKCFSPALIS